MREISIAEAQRIATKSLIDAENRRKAEAMAGAILTQTERELAAMNDASPMALKAARGQLKETQAQIASLRQQMAWMQESIDTLQSQRDTAEAQIRRLLDLQERTQAQRDAARAELNKALVVVNAARVLHDECHPDGSVNFISCGCPRCAIVAAVCDYDATQGAK